MKRIGVVTAAIAATVALAAPAQAPAAKLSKARVAKTRSSDEPRDCKLLSARRSILFIKFDICI